MSKNKWGANLQEAHVRNLPLIVTSLLCVQILTAVRDPIVIGWDLPLWLVLLDGALILINIGLVFWVRAESIPKGLSYPVAALAFACAGLKAIASIVAQAEALPLYLAAVMLGGSLCFLSMRYLVISMALILLAWMAFALPILPIGEIISSLFVTFLGAGLSIYILQRRLATITKVFELEQRVEALESILPMCASCKKTRDHTGKWQDIEKYIAEQQTGTQISHSSCPACTEKLYGDLLKNKTSSSESN